MPRYVAFLRAINVGGRVVKMERLRSAFEDLGSANVETFIASGNVVFESRSQPHALERKIEKHLQTVLGYEVAIFIRLCSGLADIASHEAFPAAKLKAPGSTLFIAFLSAEADAEARLRLLSFPSEMDEFHFHKRELYWLCHTRASDSEFSGARLEKTLGLRATVRNIKTINRLVSKYPVVEKR